MWDPSTCSGAPQRTTTSLAALQPIEIDSSVLRQRRNSDESSKTDPCKIADALLASYLARLIFLFDLPAGMPVVLAWAWCLSACKSAGTGRIAGRVGLHLKVSFFRFRGKLGPGTRGTLHTCVTALSCKDAKSSERIQT